jgi:SET domain-containing protein
MLSVPTYVAPSRIAGMGLFSARPLPEGTRIWEFTDGVDWRMTAEEVSAFPQPYQGRLRHYLYREPCGVYVLCGDNAKFMNHHRDPNCNDADDRFTVTVRDVHAGEELTCNYFEFDEESRLRGHI